VTGRRPLEFTVSLWLLALFTALAVAGLMLDGDRQTALRLGLAAALYFTVLLGWILVRGPRQNDPTPVPPAPFVASGCAAGLLSGLVRPGLDVAVVAVQMAGAGLLLGGVHWFAVRVWGRVSTRIAGP